MNKPTSRTRSRPSGDKSRSMKLSVRDKLPTNLQQTMDFEGRREHHIGLQSSRYLSMVSPYIGAFRDAIKLQYRWQLPHLPSHCTCGKKFTVEHTFSCSCGRFSSLRHNGIRDITANFLTEAAPSVLVKPTLSHSQVNNSGVTV